jgi:hypothetical protein
MSQATRRWMEPEAVLARLMLPLQDPEADRWVGKASS